MASSASTDRESFASWLSTLTPSEAPTVTALPASAKSAAASLAVLAAIGRLESVVEHETTVLRQHKATNLAEFNQRKSQGLLELHRTMRGLDPANPDGDVKSRLGGLREKLEANRAVLDTHLTAVREVAGIVARAMQDADSDGTYSARASGAGGLNPYAKEQW